MAYRICKQDITIVVYEDLAVINVAIINIDVVVITGQTVQSQ
jgi:hypothetical protein